MSAAPRWRRLPPAAFGALVTAWRTVLVVVVLAVGLAACAGPGGGASTNNDAGCAAVLPLARDTVHGQGTLALIRRVNGGDIDTITREAGVLPPAPPPGPKPSKPPPPNPVDGPPLPKTCLVVYQGAYPTRSYHRGQRTSNSRALHPGRAPGATPLDRPDPDHRHAARRHHPPPMVATNLLTRRCRRKCRIPCDNDRPARP